MRLFWIFLFTCFAERAGDRSELVHQRPAREAARANPYDGEEGAARAGSKLFQRECAGCHGSAAQGGKHAPALTSLAIRQAAAGEIFWVLRNGSLKSGMPSFSHLPEQQRWQIITYLKSLKQ